MSDSEGTITWIVVDNKMTNEFMDLPKHEGDSTEDVVDKLLEEAGWDREDCNVIEEERSRNWMMN